jgi:hypothetical protein
MKFVKEKPLSKSFSQFQQTKKTLYHNYPSIIVGNAILCLHLKNVPA